MCCFSASRTAGLYHLADRVCSSALRNPVALHFVVYQTVFACYAAGRSLIIVGQRQYMMKSNYLKKGICPECMKPLQLIRIESCTGSASNVSIWFESLPCLACSDATHSKWYASSEFSEIMNVLFEPEIFPIAQSSFLTFSRLKCFHCKEKLPKVSESVEKLTGKLSLKGIPTFALSIRAPSVRCGHCGTVQIFSSPEVSSDIADAMINAFKSVNICQQSVYTSAAG